MPNTSPLLTAEIHTLLRDAAHRSVRTLECSLDLNRSKTSVEIGATSWSWQGQTFPYLDVCKDRTIYYWNGRSFEPAARFAGSLVKLVPTEWGAPTFEIDGIKMLPTAKVSPYLDAQQKVALIEPRGKAVLDVCAGLGYFAAWCLRGGASRVLSYELNPDVIWLRGLNPWSPPSDAALTIVQGDAVQEIRNVPDRSIDAVLHDPPRFGIAGDLYSLSFYEQLARVLKRKGRLFHYTGTPNKLTTGRNVPNEVAARLTKAGFKTKLHGDGVLAVRQ